MNSNLDSLSKYLNQVVSHDIDSGHWITLNEFVQVIDTVDVPPVDLTWIDNKFKIEFIGRSFGHDIANPLTTISVNNDFIRSVISSSETHSESDTIIETLESNKNQIKKLTSKIDQIRFHTNQIVSSEISFNQFLNSLDQLIKGVQTEFDLLLSQNLTSVEINLLDLYGIVKLVEMADNIPSLIVVDNGSCGISINSIFKKGEMKPTPTFDPFDLDSYDTFSFNYRLLNKILPKYNRNMKITTQGDHTLFQINPIC